MNGDVSYGDPLTVPDADNEVPTHKKSVSEFLNAQHSGLEFLVQDVPK